MSETPEIAILAEGGMEQVEMHGKTVIHDGDEAAFCCLDQNTMLIAIDPSSKSKGLHIEPLVAAFTKKIVAEAKSVEALTKRMPKLMPAVTDLLAGKIRIGAAGSLSDVQRKEAMAEMTGELEQIRKKLKRDESPQAMLTKNGLEMVVEVMGASRYYGKLAAKSGVSVGAICGTPEKATKLLKSITTLDKGIRDMIAKTKAELESNGQMPPQFKKMFDMFALDKPLFPAKQTGKAVDVLIDLKKMSIMQMSLFMSMSRAGPM
jgi:hypothetical protein